MSIGIRRVHDLREPHVLLGEGNGKPLQYSCLENPMDGGAWWATVHQGGYELVATERLHFHFSLSRNGEGNGNPLQCSCLENPRDSGAWWAAVCGVAQSRTQLKRLRTVVQGANGVQVSSEHRLELCFHLGTAAVVVPPQHTSALNLIFSHCCIRNR